MRSWLRKLKEYFTGQKPGADDDPYAGVRQPIGKGPSPRSAGVALAEPPPDRP